MLAAKEIGGGIVRRRFALGERNLVPGDKLTGDEIRNIATTNRMALLNQHFLEVWPVTREAAASQAAERHIVNLGFGKFNVVAGVCLNTEPLTKDQAAALASEGIN